MSLPGISGVRRGRCDSGVSGAVVGGVSERHGHEKLGEEQRCSHNYASAEDRTLIYGWNKGPGVCARVSARLLPRTSVGAVSGSLKTFLWFRLRCAPPTRHGRVFVICTHVFIRIYNYLRVYTISVMAWASVSAGIFPSVCTNFIFPRFSTESNSSSLSLSLSLPLIVFDHLKQMWVTYLERNFYSIFGDEFLKDPKGR